MRVSAQPAYDGTMKNMGTKYPSSEINVKKAKNGG